MGNGVDAENGSANGVYRKGSCMNVGVGNGREMRSMGSMGKVG